jgi:hypothetical protein
MKYKLISWLQKIHYSVVAGSPEIVLQIAEEIFPAMKESMMSDFSQQRILSSVCSYGQRN